MNKFLKNVDKVMSEYQFPPAINLELTSHCNLHCVMCYRQVKDSEDGYMPIKLAMRLLHESCRKRSVIKLYWRGEPLMYPYLETFLAETRKLDVYLVLVTNGLLLDADKAEVILNSGVRKIIFSIDAITPETYGKIRQGGDLKTVQTNLLRILKMRGTCTSPAIGVNFVTLNANLSEVGGARRYWEEIVDFVDVATFNNPLGRLQEMLENGPVFERPECGGCPYPCKVKVPGICTQLQTKLFVSWQGHAFPCCMSFDNPKELCLGSLNGMSFEEVWNSKRRREVLSQYCTKNLSTCSSCQMQFNC